MGRKCSVNQCLSHCQRPEDIGVTFHKVPPNPLTRANWISLCQIPPDTVKKIMYVCSRHFLRADFCSYKGSKYMLQQGVFPSVFAWTKKKSSNGKKKTDQSGTSSSTDSEANLPIKTELDVEIKDEPLNLNNTDDNTVDDFTSEIKEETMSPSLSTIEQKLKTISTPTGTVTFAVNTTVEALDFKQTWALANIIEIDYQENEILIHFDKLSNKYDEWVSMNSSSIRAVKSTNDFELGERCLASWTDARRFPATVIRIIDKDTCEVKFDDGYLKVLKTRRMAKDSGKPMQTAPLFDPVKGTKQDRRDKKRKINVSELFKKRPRSDSQDEMSADEAPPPPPNKTAVRSKEKEDPSGWFIKWHGANPVGTDSVLEFEDGPKNTILVADSRLPPDWEKHFARRPVTGKWEVIIVNPEGIKFRTSKDIRKFYEDNNLPKPVGRFDFTQMRPVGQTKKALSSRKVLSNTMGDLLEQDICEPPPEPEIENDEPVVPSSPPLKILHIDDSYKCPIDGCGKNFRRENLAQMHIKHYHPEHLKYLEMSTPNVADLAYARTVNDSLAMDRSPGGAGGNGEYRSSPSGGGRGTGGRSRQSNSAAMGRLPPVTAVAATSKTASPAPVDDSLVSAAMASTISKQKDAEIIKLLNNKTETVEGDSLPAGMPSNMYPDIKLKDLLNKSEGVPKGNDATVKHMSTSRPSGIKTLLPVVRPTDVNKMEESDLEGAIKGNLVVKAANSGTAKTKRKRIISENLLEPKTKTFIPEYTEESQSSQELPPLLIDPIAPVGPSNIIIEGGEVIKIVQMKQEEIINCTCGITEEDGLMIQCELCLCWQHAYCNNIYRENEVPEKYICYICQHPTRQRSSRKFCHDQDWLQWGKLPTGGGVYHCIDEEVQNKRFAQLKRSHDLSGGLLELREFVRTLKLKIKISEAKNHPKLYLWSKPWPELPLPEKVNQLKSEPKLEVVDGNADQPSDSMLFALLNRSKDDHLKMKDEPLPDFPKLDLNALMANMESSTTVPTSQPIQPVTKTIPIAPSIASLPNIPQPEAAIENVDCRLNLLRHISHCQNLCEERLEDFEKSINEIDGSYAVENDTEYTRVRETTQMLMRDLLTLKELSYVTSF